jgi:hypothetical protein
VTYLGVIANQRHPDANLISKQILRYNLSLADLLLFRHGLVQRLLAILIKTNSPLVKKTQLKKLNKIAPWCLTTLKCLL